MASRRRQELGVGVLLLGAAVLLGWMALQVGAVGSLGPQVRVEARIRDAAGIGAGAAVTVAGVDVGRVEAMRLDHDEAVADITLDRAAGVREGAALRVRARSVLGEKYLELTQGPREAPLLADGSLLRVDADQTEIDEMVGAMGPLVGAVDAEAVAASLRVLSEALREDPERIKRMLEASDRLLSRGADAADRLPALLDRVEGTLGRADRALDAVTDVAERARVPLASAGRVAAGLEAPTARLPALLDDASAALGEARAVAVEARETLAGFDGVDAKVGRVLDNLVEIDKWELRRLLREEGILIRVKPREVVPTPSAP